MAQIIINTTPEDDLAAQRMTALHNSQFPNPGDHLTPLQFFRQHVRHMLDGWIAKTGSRTNVSRIEAFKALPPDRQQAVDAILSEGGFNG